MKASTKILSTIIFSIGLMGTSQAKPNKANKITAADSTIATKLCVAAAQGNRAALHNSINASGMSKSHIVKNVTCNQQPIKQFIALHSKNAEKINEVFKQYNNNQHVKITDLAAL